MPPKIRELVKKACDAGFTRTPYGKGSHRRYTKNGVTITICGHDGDDAKTYQIKHVANKIKEANNQGAQ
jgi:predicted RNA binding protein YcfA (HicA-like mRNA interferase family)